MPRFLFKVQQGKLPAAFVLEGVHSDKVAARREALGICADLAKDIVSSLTSDPEWRLDVLDEFGAPVFRIRLLAEALDA